MRAIVSTLRFRTTLLHVAVFGLTLLAFGAVIYTVYARNQRDEFDGVIYNRAVGVARSISIDTQGQIEINNALIEESGRAFPFQFGNEYIELRATSGAPFARSKNLGTNSLPLAPPVLALLQQGQFAYVTFPGNGPNTPFWGHGDLRVLSRPLAAQGQVQLLLQIGVSTQALDQSLARLRTALFLVGIPITLLLTGAGGWWLAGRSFAPINRIITAAQHLGVERLEDRLPVPGAEDELRHLSLTLNEMLDRLERSFKSQQRFVADASHELKTPLTILQGELDVLRRQPRSPAEYQAFLASASEELQRISQIIHNLLLLARADSGRPLPLKADVRLDEVALEAIERLQSFAARGQVKLSMKIGGGDDVEEDKPWLGVRGDTDLLASLLFNLVHNAIKHSSAGQTVEIRVEPSGTGARVSVRDEGTGIRVEDLPHIFERFHRAENPTHRDATGTGLGLAIAKWIAEAHGATLRVESKPAEGSTFTLEFPGTAAIGGPSSERIRERDVR